MITLALTAGIVGLPNVGKSTLFNAITKSTAHAANYPFATIDPNVGVVNVPDKRLYDIAEIIKPKETIPTGFEFTDIAGLVKGASKGEGLGNQFLAHIREVDAIVQVVRCFEDDDVMHVDGTINPLRDIETINTELIFADLDIVEKRLPKIEKKAQLKVETDILEEFKILKAIHEGLLENKPIRQLGLDKNERKTIQSYGFLTLKPIIYVCNVSEDMLQTNVGNDFVDAVFEKAAEENATAITISAQIEAEMSELDESDKRDYLTELGLYETGLDRLIQESYNLLNLRTFFTAGEKEVRAWTFKEGMTAPECAGVIHSDFQKGFIRAETIAYDDLMHYGSMIKAKEAGKLRLEGKEYKVKDGDILLFRFNV